MQTWSKFTQNWLSQVCVYMRMLFTFIQNARKLRCSYVFHYIYAFEGWFDDKSMILIPPTVVYNSMHDSSNSSVHLHARGSSGHQILLLHLPMTLKKNRWCTSRYQTMRVGFLVSNSRYMYFHFDVLRSYVEMAPIRWMPCSDECSNDRCAKHGTGHVWVYIFQ